MNRLPQVIVSCPLPEVYKQEAGKQGHCRERGHQRGLDQMIIKTLLAMSTWDLPGASVPGNGFGESRGCGRGLGALTSQTGPAAS